MKYLYSKYLQFTEAKVTLPLIVGTTILSSLVARPSQAFNITFSFSSDSEYTNDTGLSAANVVNEWDHGSGLQDGWQAGQNTGTATDSTTGLQITFTGAPRESNSSLSNRLIGDARTNDQNFNFDERGQVTTKGMKIEDTNLSDDGNVATLNGTSTRELIGGTLANYQLLTFSFSEPIVIDSNTRFFIDDVDDDSRTGSNETYIDALGIEAFTSSSVGEAGTGIDPNFSFETTTELTTGTIDFSNGNDINYVYDFTDNSSNLANEPQNRVYYDFGSTEEVQSIALYFFNGLPASAATNNTSGHAVVFGGSFDVQPAATAVPFEFSPGLGLLLSGGSLLAIKHLKRRKLQKSI